jgi:hypothetical protein
MGAGVESSLDASASLGTSCILISNLTFSHTIPLLRGASESKM